ncbi:MAG: DUF72 domain-containing protein [Candidatus Nanopelagicales bacterium]
MPELRIGVSGWKYPNWRGDFYPAELRQNDELPYVAQRLNSAEINGSFYSLQKPEHYSAWHDATPPGFCFAVKGGRFITHLKKLTDPGPGLANFFASGPLALADKLGPFLWQLPESLHFDEGRLRGFLRRLPHTAAEAATQAQECDRRIVKHPHTPALTMKLRHALELRHESYRGCADLLREYGVAMVVADTGGRFPAFDEVTADFVYVRLHGPHQLYHGSYQPHINRWADRVKQWTDRGLDVYVYFDNDADGAAPFDAMALAEALGISP